MKKYYCDWCLKEITERSSINSKFVKNKIKIRFFHDDPEDEFWKRNDIICSECREKFDGFIIKMRHSNLNKEKKNEQ